MNTRSLSPFFVSFAFLALQGMSSISVAQNSPAPALVRGEVTTMKQTLSREQLSAMLSRQLTERFSPEGELQIDLFSKWIDPVPSVDGYNVTILEYPSQLTSSMPLRVRLSNPTMNPYDFVLMVKVQVWRDAWVAKQTVERDSIFDPTVLETRRVDALGLGDRQFVFANTGDRSLVFATRVQAGRVLTWRDLTKRPLVKRNELVDVTASEGSLTITMKALALQNGSIGDIISVRNLDSKKSISVIVVGDNRAQVRF